jgi:GntR family transcriptional repressor for pyruvate dehydrogenase complex
MEPMGLVSRVAKDLERLIAQDRLPRDGRLPSERLLSRQYGVSRSTVREALSRLSSRGLIVQHPGRRSRAVALDEIVNLDLLGVALKGEGPARPERSRLLEGFLALKRDLTVELLAACCERGSQMELDRLVDACLALRDAARWEENRGQWAVREFELLRQAARVADRPGHVLLIHSLERSFWGMAGRVLPHLDSASICRWAECALYALAEKDALGLRRDLPPLLEAGDERLLGSREGLRRVSVSEAVTSTITSKSAGPELPGPEAPIPATARAGAVLLEAATSEESPSAALAPEPTPAESPSPEPSTPTAQAARADPVSGEPSTSEPPDTGGLTAAVWPRWSDCQTSSYETTTAGGPVPAPDSGERPGGPC